VTGLCHRHGVPGEADVAAEISLVGNVMHGRSKKNDAREWTRKSSLDLDSFA